MHRPGWEDRTDGFDSALQHGRSEVAYLIVMSRLS